MLTLVLAAGLTATVLHLPARLVVPVTVAEAAALDLPVTELTCNLRRRCWWSAPPCEPIEFRASSDITMWPHAIAVRGLWRRTWSGLPLGAIDDRAACEEQAVQKQLTGPA